MDSFKVDTMKIGIKRYYNIILTKDYNVGDDLFQILFNIVNKLGNEGNIIVSLPLFRLDHNIYHHIFTCVIRARRTVNGTMKRISLELFNNAENAISSLNTVDPYSIDKNGQCLNMEITKIENEDESVNTIGHIGWISTNDSSSYQIKSVDLFMSLSDQINNLFKVRESRLSDEAEFKCNLLNINLTLSYIFKYVNTFYNRRFRYIFDYESFNERFDERNGFNMFIQSRKDLEDYYESIKIMDINTFIFPDIDFYEREEDFNEITRIKNSSLYIGEFFSKVLSSRKRGLGCEMYHNLFSKMRHINYELRKLYNVCMDTSGFYHKLY